MIVPVLVIAPHQLLDTLRSYIQGSDESCRLYLVVKIPKFYGIQALLASPPAISARNSRASSSRTAL